MKYLTLEKIRQELKIHYGNLIQEYAMEFDLRFSDLPKNVHLFLPREIHEVDKLIDKVTELLDNADVSDEETIKLDWETEQQVVNIYKEILGKEM